MTAISPSLSRRGVLSGGGALILSFTLAAVARGQEAQPGGAPEQKPPLPGSLKSSPLLDSWIKIDRGGAITVFTGKAELGQGIKTALLQVAAEELRVLPDVLKLVTADTLVTANEGYTAGSHSMQDSGTAIRNAAAQVREILFARAAARLGVAPDTLYAREGSVLSADGRELGYGQLVPAGTLHVQAQPASVLTEPDKFTVIGRSLPRVDIPAKVTGGLAYVQDMRMPGMVHGRIVRPPSPGARLIDADTLGVSGMPGVLKVVRDGNFLAVIADREFTAVKAMRALSAAARWEEQPTLPRQADLFATVTSLPSQDLLILDNTAVPPAGTRTVRARFTRPYQMHGSIGPSCAIGEMTGGVLTVWTHTQGVFPDRNAIAEMLGMPPDHVRCIHVEGSGCYGHNGADDAAADAALLARALPDRPVRVQWHREQENAWEPFGPAMVTQMQAQLDGSGAIVDWDYEVWSNTHSTRPGPAGALLAARHLAKPFPVPPGKPLPLPEGGGDRNAIPLYTFPSTRVMHHFIAEMPLRVSAMRALGAYMNVFSIESFMDELAQQAGADPVEFRLRHLQDPRARDVVTTAAERFGWANAPAKPGRANGFAFARYKNLASYLALACEMEVERETGRARMVRAVAAIDAGEAVNPDGIRNQTEGGILQAMSWTLYESVTFDETRITSVDWATYPILRFSAVPDSVEVHVMPRPGERFLGAGEAAQGPTAAAVGNALSRIVGKRMADLPLTREKLKAAIGV